MLRIFTDFDGPIVDVSERYYRVYEYCLKQIGTQYANQKIHFLPKEKFWLMKRDRVSEQQIGMISGLNKEQAVEFANLRKKTVHTQPYFEYDSLAPGAVEALTRLKKQNIDLAVMTMRRVSELDFAFAQHNLGRFFPENRCYCLSNDYIKTRDVDDKPLLMQRALEELPRATDTWMIGDTEADIAAAKKHGIKVIAVECGIRSRTQLESFQPDLIVKDLSAAIDVVLENSKSLALSY
ncbi:haloacid dehalogenase-like hydrolase [Calothrix sp. NIES-4071]|nr:haloacid dehalogenase-like hydrolase [Calothrix sp. NIES-4071]BAZ63796.1 haloacid dehalogenase-like hydrolase [Calothrix sp. NIES-4105]